MSHRVHTILSILAEDHAPAALRPSILLAVDWPTVAEEAPATGDDANAATLVALRLRGAITDNHPAIAPLAARIATVAASIATTGDKAHAIHATALWGAAAALVGIPSAAPPVSWGAEMNRVMDERDAAHSTIDALAAKLLNLARQGRDRALGDIHALRDILKVPEGGNLVDHASAFAERHSRMHAENTRLRAQVDRMIAAMRDDAPTCPHGGNHRTCLAMSCAAMREDAPAPVKPRPQPGDVVPWVEVEDGALYAKDWGGCRFVMVARGERSVTNGPEDRDIETFLLQHDVLPPAGEKEMTLVARGLGANPEAWRKAMREWTASESSRPR